MPISNIATNVASVGDAIDVFRAPKITFCAKVKDVYSKLFKVVFQKSDGSLIITFPYFCDSRGLVSICTFPPTPTGHVDKISLSEHGKVTSHLVKYVHHADGRVHFSQDRKVLTSMVKQSAPLGEYSGHAFTIQLQGLDGFNNWIDDGCMPNHGNTASWITWLFGNSLPYALAIHGYIYSQRAIRGRSSGSEVGPVMQAADTDGSVKSMVLCSAPKEYPLSHMRCCMICETRSKLDPKHQHSLSFIGGFDRMPAVFNRTRASHFLALMYPCHDIDDLSSRIGSIDFPIAPQF